MQMQTPKIRHVQVPAQRKPSTGTTQLNSNAERHNVERRQEGSNHVVSKQAQRSQSYQENGAKPQHRNGNNAVNNHSQNRMPLQPQSTPQSTPQRTDRTTSTPDSHTGQTRPSSQNKARVQVVIPRNPSNTLSPTKHAKPQPKALPVDLSVMLLSAADEYIAAAHSLGPSIVQDTSGTTMQQYQRLMATALGCMDAILKDFNMLPRDEAKLRLRYISLLVEETNNTGIIDESLSKQLSLCARCKLEDLKYATMHLEARYQFKTNHRVAFKSLHKTITDAEAYKNIPWVYALRFLMVSLLLQSPGRSEVVPALQQLRAIQKHAETFEDRAIYVACNALEAVIHLRSTVSDRLEQAQRAIAAARSFQLQIKTEDLGAFGTLLEIVDLACGIQQGQPNEEKSKKLVESLMEDNVGPADKSGGLFALPLGPITGQNLNLDTGGIFQKGSDGRNELTFSWLRREDVLSLCFLLCAVDQNIHEKGLNYAHETHQRTKEALKGRVIGSGSLYDAFQRAEWNHLLHWHSLFTLGMIAFYQENHVTARKALTALRQKITQPRFASQEACTRLLSYMSAINDQKSGMFESAIAAYCSSSFSLPEENAAPNTTTNLNLELSILSALNLFTILRDPSRSQQSQAKAIALRLQPICENHPNQYLRTAFRVVYAISSEKESIVMQKQLMQRTSTQANAVFNATKNRELVILALCYYTSRFFADQAGDHAIKAVRATKQNAKLSKKPWWIAVAYGLAIPVYRHSGLNDEAETFEKELERHWPNLPAGLRGEDDVDAEGEDDDE